MTTIPIRYAACALLLAISCTHAQFIKVADYSKTECIKLNNLVRVLNGACSNTADGGYSFAVTCASNEANSTWTYKRFSQPGCPPADVTSTLSGTSNQCFNEIVASSFVSCNDAPVPNTATRTTTGVALSLFLVALGCIAIRI
jgi:hypothetical protein